ncbi:hypothetical protein NC653_019055 [Populus alba x Populus x berolinensis]|uniref:Uncharacterized protein n=1 Tax=Populus alba x Populus x berolinensis TaxID=444605 RepID=A0AAD6QHV0_9ROSI|nr:hypothetical protein NC653_019055 [Populus alba x Populus x berolinensis]
MVENSSNGASSMASALARSDDPVWAHEQVGVGTKNSRINGSAITRLSPCWY